MLEFGIFMIEIVVEAIATIIIQTLLVAVIESTVAKCIQF